MAFLKAGKLADLLPGSMRELSQGDDLYVICNLDGTLHAISGVCLHQGGPLGQGNLIDGRVICPWHAWEYDCRTGESMDDPTQCVARYEVKVEDGEILIQVP
jgi:nitrite reductase/ring-hydroxylating ferredoxin subunit